MLKESIIIICIVAVIVFGNFFIENYLDKSSNDILVKLDDLSTQIVNKENDDFDNIKSEVNALEEKWNELKNIWMLIVLHSDIDNVDSTFKETYSTLQIKSLDETYQNLKKMHFLIEDMTQKDKFDIRNIF